VRHLSNAELRGLVVDVAVILAATLLAALRVLPSEAVIAVLGAVVGARARDGGGGPGAAGELPRASRSLSDTSVVAALAVGLFSALAALDAWLAKRAAPTPTRSVSWP
jgi:hypothetical protein